MGKLHDEVVNTKAIQRLNDRFRSEGLGRGSVYVTAGVHTQGEAFTDKVFQAVRAYDSFTEDNDPWSEHDFGVITLCDEKIFWKIDYYDLTRTAGSENPADEAITHRVLTIMLASEY